MFLKHSLKHVRSREESMMVSCSGQVLLQKSLHKTWNSHPQVSKLVWGSFPGIWPSPAAAARVPPVPLLMKWGLLCWCPNLLFTKSCILLILKELRKFLLHFNLSFLLLNLPNLKIGTHEVDPQWPMLTVDWLLKKAAANNCDICTFFNLLRTTTDKNSLDFYFLSFPTWRKEISIFNNMW